MCVRAWTSVCMCVLCCRICADCTTVFFQINLYPWLSSIWIGMWNAWHNCMKFFVQSHAIHPFVTNSVVIGTNRLTVYVIHHSTLFKRWFFQAAIDLGFLACVLCLWETPDIPQQHWSTDIAITRGSIEMAHKSRANIMDLTLLHSTVVP